MTIDLSMPNPCDKCGRDLNLTLQAPESTKLKLCFECYVKRLVAIEVMRLMTDGKHE